MTVYFHIQSNDRIKIGHTNNPIEERRRDLQTGSGHPLVCLGGMHGDRLLERQLHYIFSPYKISDTGEWYWAVPPIMNFINKFTSKFEENEEYEERENDKSQTSSVILTPIRATAIIFLKNIFMLGGQPIMGTEVIRRARDLGIKDTTLRRAARDLNIDIRTVERDQAVGPVPWYPPKEWPLIIGLERFSDLTEESENFAEQVDQ